MKNGFWNYAKYIAIYLLLSIIGTCTALLIVCFQKYGDINAILENADPTMLIEGTPYLLLSVAFNNLLMICYSYTKRDELDLESLKINKYPMFFVMGFGINIIISLFLSLILPAEVVQETNEASAALFMGSPALVILATSIITPISEELLFRGLLLNVKFPYNVIAKRRGVDVLDEKDANLAFFWAALIQAFLFGFSHGSLIQGAYTMVMGFLFAYINRKEGSLLPSIFIHSGLNMFAAMTNISDSLIYPGLLIGLVGAVILVWYLISNRKVLFK